MKLWFSRRQKSGEFLSEMRDLARWLGEFKRDVTIDDLRVEASARGIKSPASSLWANILRGSEWRRIGTRQSSYPANKGRYVGVYRHV